MLGASVWKPRSDGSNPRQTLIESKSQNILHQIPSTVWIVDLLRTLLWIYLENLLRTFRNQPFKRLQAAVLSTLKLQFGGEFRFFSLEPADKTEQVSALRFCFIACLFGLVEVGTRGRHIDKRQYCVWDRGLATIDNSLLYGNPILTYFANTVNGEICLVWPIRLSKLKEFCYIFITCYFPLHAGSD